jgi:nucleoid-associated protein YgaU
MSRTRVRRRRLAVLLSAGLVAAFWAGPVAEAFQGPAVTPAARRIVVVRAGDTLWSIAERLSPGEDPRPLVDAIARANHVDATTIVPGQTLIVPVG